MKRKLITLAVLAALLPAAVAGYNMSGFNVQAAAASDKSVAQASLPSAAAQGVVPATQGIALPDFSTLVAQVGPAVVNINVTKAGSANGSADAQAPGTDEQDSLREFFRRFQGPNQNRGPVRGVGSGFIVSADGYVLTNAHVVKGAEQVNVKLTDRREFSAKVIGQDARSDVALLKIEASGLPYVKLGDASKVRVGQWVVAVGSPFGFENSVTAGIVSAKSRSLPDGSYVPFIQTDVAINPGNSGGPLFDLSGNVIGINSQIYSETGGYMGLSFAIPIDVAMNVKDQLLQSGKVTRGRIGVVVQEVNQDLAQSFGMKKPMGALVSAVEPGGPAARGGVKAGDVIIGFAGKEIDSSSDLPQVVANIKPGQAADLRVWRDGGETSLKVTVGELPAQKLASAALDPASTGRLGVAVRGLNADEQRQLNAPGGVLVEQAGGAAARAGVQPGDVILAVNNQQVASPEQLQSLIKKSGKHVALLIQRADAKVYIPVDLA
ncbi:MAG: DegQ family serine endoprotease [Betaproteobacteria bacterium]|nr:DegQ family serine endoprotease [Betaproteobacteria bacterium]